MRTRPQAPRAGTATGSESGRSSAASTAPCCRWAGRCRGSRRERGWPPRAGDVGAQVGAELRRRLDVELDDRLLQLHRLPGDGVGGLGQDERTDHARPGAVAVNRRRGDLDLRASDRAVDVGRARGQRVVSKLRVPPVAGAWFAVYPRFAFQSRTSERVWPSWDRQIKTRLVSSKLASGARKAAASTTAASIVDVGAVVAWASAAREAYWS